MQDKIKKFGKRTLFVLPWIALLVIGVWYASNLLSDAIVNEFVTPFLK